MKKKLLSVLTLSLLIALLLSVQAFALGGKGTETNPFRISTEEELLLLHDFPSSHFELENDITLTKDWTPVAEFSGTLDGKGHTIFVPNLPYVSVEKSGSSSYLFKMGFFTTLTGVVKNTTYNYNINFSVPSEHSSDTVQVGFIAHTCKGKISNCKTDGEATISSYPNIDMGQLVYSTNIDAIVENCIVSTPIVFKSLRTTTIMSVFYGEFVYTNAGSITNCYDENMQVNKDGSSTYLRVKLLCESNSGQISNCYSAASVNTTFAYLVNNSSGTVTSCYYDKVLCPEITDTTSGKSTIAMKMEATYTDWDFENVWAIDDSEENPINNGYPYLISQYGENTAPNTSSTAYIANGNIVLDTKIRNTSTADILHVALYDESNMLIGYIVVPNERLLTDVVTVFEDNGASFAKVFTWSDLESIEPVYTAETVTIKR